MNGVLLSSYLMQSLTIKSSLAEVSVQPMKLCSRHKFSISDWLMVWRSFKSHCAVPIEC